MKWLLTGKQMREADLYTIEKIGISSLVLMERAAIKVADAVMRHATAKERILIVCGSGNNGGDGYAVARLLHVKGYTVHIWFVGNDTSRSSENQAQKKICDFYQIPVVEHPRDEYDMIVDGIFGTGLSRDISGKYREVIEEVNRMHGYKIAIDIPSGIHDGTGQVMGVALKADMSVAIAYMKRGMVLQPGNIYAGEIEVADIGIYDEAIADAEQLAYTYEWEDFKERYPKRTVNSHKGTYGKIGLIVGSKGMSGAAYLASKAAYMTGAGLVQVFTHEDNRVIIQQLLPEAIVTTYEEFEQEKLDQLLAWSDVICLGCGLGQNETAEKIVNYTLKNAACPCVVDADGLNILAKNLEILKERNAETILTPHMKEMTRLCDCDITKLSEERVELLLEFVNQYPVTCVLKDARTVVAEKESPIYINMSGNSAMAKGGSGDVLAGIIAGVWANSKNRLDAATVSVYLHGLAGDKARDKKGSYSVLASDIVDSIGEILKEI